MCYSKLNGLNMCGLNAIFNPLGVRSHHINVVSEMNAEMLYRGPDAQVVWSNDKVVFGHNRLSIIGLDNGSQPIFNNDKSLILVCNGEIYNYLELKADLEKEGIKFHTESDSEVILYLYEKYGTQLFSHLRGMFAFCLWDETNQKLVIARDRMGKKPLYYAQGSLGIAISSEIKTITKYFLNNFSINNVEVTKALKYSRPLSEKDTVINEVKKVRPGEYVVFENDIIKIDKYWDILSLTRQNNSNKSKSEFQKEIYNTFQDSVNIRLRSDVPVAVLLSSGIDSCSVAALAKKSREEVHAITVGYKESGSNDEREYAKKYAKEKGLIYHEVELDQKDFKRYFEEYTSVIDEPVCDIAAIAQWGIYKKAKELGFKVLLSGIGGDELFFGYQYHNQFGQSWDCNIQLKKFFPINSIKGYLALLRYVFKNRLLLNQFSKKTLESHFTRFFHDSFSTFKSDFTKKNSVNSFKFSEFELEFYNTKKNGIDNLYQFMLNEWLINNCFYQTDKLAMGNSVEVRAPFADNVLIEKVMQTPFDVLYTADNPKGFLKEMMANDLPDYILKLHKKGFTPPLGYIDDIVKSYNSKFFKSSICHYNQVVTDKLLNNYFQ